MASMGQGNALPPRLVAIGTTPTLISNKGQWVARILINEGTGSVRIGGSTVTYDGSTTDGLLLISGSPFTDDASLTAWYAVCAAATTANVSVVECK